METESDNLTARESIAIITRMINEAKGHIRQNSFYFLLWGWTIMLAQLGMFSLFMADYRYPYIAWAITIPAWIVSMIRGFRSERHAVIKTHFDTISGWLWMSFSVVIFTLVFFGYKINFQLNPVILLVTAIPTFVSGAILKFRPLMMGGLVFWVAGLISFLVDLPMQPLIGAAAIVAGYLIPGYILKNQQK